MNKQATAVRPPSARNILDVFEALFRAAAHPGIKDVQPYGPGVGGFEGVKVRFEWGNGDYLWAYLFADGDDRKPAPKPFAADVPYAPDPDSESGRKWLVVDYVLKLVHDLCVTARPDAFTGCVPVALHNVVREHGPSGLRVATTDGAARILRVTIGSGNTKDPEEDPWVGYEIPEEGVRAWKEHRQVTPKEPETQSSVTAATASGS